MPFLWAATSSAFFRPAIRLRSSTAIARSRHASRKPQVAQFLFSMSLGAGPEERRRRDSTALAARRIRDAKARRVLLAFGPTMATPYAGAFAHKCFMTSPSKPSVNRSTSESRACGKMRTGANLFVLPIRSMPSGWVECRCEQAAAQRRSRGAHTERERDEDGRAVLRTPHARLPAAGAQRSGDGP